MADAREGQGLAPPAATAAGPALGIRSPAAARARSPEEWAALAPRLESLWLRDRELAERLAGGGELPGYCAPCARPSRFRLPEKPGDGALRESLACLGCGLINRVRAVLAHWLAEARPAPAAPIFLAERLTPLYGWLAARFPGLVGAEYLGSGRAPGSVLPGPDGTPLRHEDLGALSFADRSLDHAICLEILEHLPDHRPALRELARVLRPGGWLVLSAPFDPARVGHLLRASLDEEGRVVHHLPPEYHGDPLRPEGGVLCWRVFGWALLGELAALGFDPELLLFWSPLHGHLGWPNVAVVARRVA